MSEVTENQAREHKNQGLEKTNKKNVNSAIKNCTEAMTGAAYYQKRAFYLLKLNLYENSKEDAIESLKLDPNISWPYLIAAKCCIYTGNTIEAKKWMDMRKGLAIFFQVEKIRNMIRLLEDFNDLMNNQEYRQAIDKIRQLLDIKTCAYFELLNAYCLVHLEKYEEAQLIIDKFCFEDMYSQAEMCLLFFISGLILYYKGQIYNVSTHFEVALIHSKGLSLSEKILEFREKSINIENRVAEAESCVTSKKYLTALNAINYAMKIDASNKIISKILHFQRGKLFMKLENFVSAIQDFSVTLSTDKSNIQALMMRTQCFEELKMIENQHRFMKSVPRGEKRAGPSFGSGADENRNENGRKRMRINPGRDNNSFYEIMFIPKNCKWSISKTVDGQRSFYPFQNESNLRLNASLNAKNDLVYKIRLYNN